MELTSHVIFQVEISKSVYSGLVPFLIDYNILNLKGIKNILKSWLEAFSDIFNLNGYFFGDNDQAVVKPSLFPLRVSTKYLS